MGDLTQEQTVLVVDDMPDNISILSSILSDDYKVKAATRGKAAVKIALKTQPDLILLDIMMPEMDGYEICRTLKCDPRTRNIPVIFITALGEVEDEKTGFEYGAVDYITKPVSPSIVKARVRTHLDLYDQSRVLGRMVAQRTKELDRSRLELIRRLSRASEFRDNETGRHVIRMSHYSRIIAEALGLNEEETNIIFNATPMHDVGKIGIPDTILLKPGKLTDEENRIMQKHAEFGANIIGIHDDSLLKTAWIVALTHHEKWDGTGYPRGLAGEDIPLEGRITAIADVFDALTSERSYKKSWTLEEALEYVVKEKGRHFDPDLADLFVSQTGKIEAVLRDYSDSCHGEEEG
jgi:putative two-component system response regulator